jgi:phosphoribosylglycinamide formyltransferase-1
MATQAPVPGPLPVGVLVSGTGTNLRALLETVHGHEAEVVAVASSADGVRALDHARQAGVDHRVFSLEAYPDRAQRDLALARYLLDRGVRLVVLAGYMQLLTPGFLSHFPRAVINVHPALLPAFPGLSAIEQAVAHGVRVFGVTVHFVDEGVDTGPIILQRAIELADAVDPAVVHERLRPLEHALLPEAVRLFARGALHPAADNPRRIVIDNPATGD